MERIESRYYLVEDVPNLFLFDWPLQLFMLADLCLQIPSVTVLHHDTKSVRFFLEECLFVGSDVRMLNRGQDPNLVDCVVLFFLAEFGQFDLQFGEF